MTDHKISANGLNIECHAAPDANCRTRPDCDAEGWDSSDCLGHDPGHPVTGGHDCWMLVWVDSTELDQTYDGPGAPVTIYPGRAVVIEWNGDDCSWHYAHQEGETMAEQDEPQATEGETPFEAAARNEAERRYQPLSQPSWAGTNSALGFVEGARWAAEQPHAPHRWLTTTEEIETLSAGSIIRSKRGIVRERFSTGWLAIGGDGINTSEDLAMVDGGHELLHDGATDE